MTPTTIQLIGTILFAVAIVHTFATALFEHLAQTRPAHAGLWHLLGEVEVAFGFWALVLIGAMFVTDGTAAATQYLSSRSFTEPMFVFASMVIAGEDNGFDSKDSREAALAAHVAIADAGR